MSINVYFDNRELSLTQNLDSNLSEDIDAIHQYTDFGEFKQFLEKFKNNVSLKKGILFGDDPSNLLTHLKASYKYIEAAGGMVYNANQEGLFIFKRGKWDLPKGKRKKNEAIEDTAIREVIEECGIVDCKISARLNSTYHTYQTNSKCYLKKTVWFSMQTKSKKLTPQREEGIEIAKWVPQENWHDLTNNTYPSIIKVLEDIKNGDSNISNGK